jgi:hypothetical protein
LFSLKDDRALKAKDDAAELARIQGEVFALSAKF